MGSLRQDKNSAGRAIPWADLASSVAPKEPQGGWVTDSTDCGVPGWPWVSALVPLFPHASACRSVERGERQHPLQREAPQGQWLLPVLMDGARNSTRPTASAQ